MHRFRISIYVLLTAINIAVSARYLLAASWVLVCGRTEALTNGCYEWPTRVVVVSGIVLSSATALLLSTIAMWLRYRWSRISAAISLLAFSAVETMETIAISMELGFQGADIPFFIFGPAMLAWAVVVWVVVGRLIPRKP